MEPLNPFAVYRSVRSNDTPSPGKTKWILRNSVMTLAHLGLLLLTTILFAVTSWYVHLSHVSDGDSTTPQVKSSRLAFSLAALRVLQEATSVAVSALVLRSLILLQWALTTRKNGVRLLTALGFTPSTTTKGLLKILYTTAANLFERLAVSIRYAHSLYSHARDASNIRKATYCSVNHASCKFGFIQ
jgi:hypothetical protein